MRITVLRRLLTLLQSSATLADLSAFEDAWGLVRATDQIAIGMELYNHPAYSMARQALLEYIVGRVEESSQFELYLTEAITCAKYDECARAYEFLAQAAKCSKFDVMMSLLNETRSVVQQYCPHPIPLDGS
jgi:hypothetical protein